MRWCKDTTRRNEVLTLLQGRSLPPLSVVAVVPLLPPQTRPTEPPLPPENPLVFSEPEDTVGMARVRGAPSISLAVLHTTVPPLLHITSTSPPASTSATSSTSLSPYPAGSATELGEPSNVATSVTVVTTSRTTSWRHRKAEDAWRQAKCSSDPPPSKRRKAYTCQLCGQTKGKGKRPGDLAGIL